ncbi:hypothetical protein H257_03202 [Aphanomyces astaci]|uniref:Uncharacterized protein n=1 Tax=Aphanomyces astaci TaxID=112090 RepID=W4H0E3_APHAT|nr:hypothetical protein H257_03202 [Aphanomyces astaci]ETV85470.1 hypothetical protein H257_03202 [Aphanomyces astaci]|eukprot:XP_009825488.1 hypothetical protein H257_03202 [Aphanomyces astaci]
MWVHNGLWLQHRARRSKERAPHLPLRPLWLDLYTSHTTQLEAFAAWCGFAEGFDLVDNLVGVVVLRAGRYCIHMQGEFAKRVATSKQLATADKQVDVTTVVSLRQGDVVRVQTLGPKAVLASGAILNMYELYVY